MGNTLKILGSVITLVGIITGLLYLLGFFAHGDRELMVQRIREKGRVGADSLAFEEFLDRFPPPEGWSPDEITGVGLLAFSSTGGSVTPLGPLIYVGEGKQTCGIGTFQELVEWSKQSCYPWISLAITAVGWGICAVGVFLDVRSRSTKDTTCPVG